MKTKKIVRKIQKSKNPIIFVGVAIATASTALAMALVASMKNMKKSAEAQHEADKAQLAAVKAESRAQWAEAKAMGSAETREKLMQAQRDEQIAAANKRKVDAEARMDAVGG